MKEASENMMENQERDGLERTAVIPAHYGFCALSMIAALPFFQYRDDARSLKNHTDCMHDFAFVPGRQH
jgi:hypothetical protein